MSGQEELTESLDNEEEGLISEKMLRKITYLIHKLAEMKGREYMEIQKKCRSIFKYTNLAKVSREDAHAIIDELIKMTGGVEEEKQEQGARIKDEVPKLPREPDDGFKNEEKKTVQEKDDTVTGTMREAVRAAVDITLKEVVKKDVSVQGLGGFVLEIGKVIFDAKRAEELSRGGSK